MWGTVFYSPPKHVELAGYWAVDNCGNERQKLGNGFWRSIKPYCVTRKLTQKVLDSLTKPAAHHFSLFHDNGAELGVGAFPSKDPFSAAVATIGRQMYGKSGNRKYVHDFRTVSRFYARRIMTECTQFISTTGQEDRLTRERFDVLLKSIPRSKRDAVWEAHEHQLVGLPSKGWDDPGAFNKLECCLKSIGPTVKPRGIVTMPLRIYVEAIHTLAAQEIIYACPSVERWMIKHCDTSAVFEKVRQVYSQPHVSQDISGFENALVPEVRLIEQLVVPGVLKALGFPKEANVVRDIMGRCRKIKTPNAKYDVNVRCSGDFWTSLGNGLVNIALILTGDYVRKGRPALTRWWGQARNLTFVTEGDDALLPAALQNREVTQGLRMEFSLLTVADQPGGADFLKVAYYPIYDANGRFQGKLGNTLRWARGLTFVFGENFRESKRLFLLRAKAWSIHYLQPGHPMTSALVFLIGRLTSGHTAYSGWEQHASKWGVDWKNIDVSRPIPYVEPSDELRAALATSRCPDIPAITLESQLLFEQECLNWKGGKIHFPAAWKRYPEWDAMFAGREYLSSQPMFEGRWTSPLARDLFEFAFT